MPNGGGKCGAVSKVSAASAMDKSAWNYHNHQLKSWCFKVREVWQFEHWELFLTLHHCCLLNATAFFATCTKKSQICIPALMCHPMGASHKSVKLPTYEKATTEGAKALSCLFLSSRSRITAHQEWTAVCCSADSSKVFSQQPAA